MSLGWEPLEDLYRRAQRLGPEAFLARHPGPFLVGLHDEPSQPGQFWAPALQATPGGKMLVPRANAQSLAHELLKVSGTGARTMLSAGRAAYNDVVFAERSISALHAVFEEQDHGWRVKDGGSRYGLRLNGAPVGPQGSPLKSGDVLILGDVAAAFYATADLLNVLPTWCSA